METPASAALAAYYAVSPPRTSLCVSVQASQSSVKHGQAAQWVVSAWAEYGTVSNATLRVSASPAGQVPEFSFGCGSQDGTSSCNLGSVYSGSAQRQVIARITVPASAASVNSVRLTASVSATNLTQVPAATATVAVHGVASGGKPPTSAVGTGTSPSTGAGHSTVSPIPVGALPTVGTGSSSASLSPGGNASGLFPTVNPSAVPGSAATNGGTEAVRPVANSEALPIGTPVVDGQLIGLAALGVAFLLAVTRLSIRRRPALAAAGLRAAQTVPVATPTESAPTRPAATEPAPGEPAPTTIDQPADDISVSADQAEAETRPDIPPVPPETPGPDAAS